MKTKVNRSSLAAFCAGSLIAWSMLPIGARAADVAAGPKTDIQTEFYSISENRGGQGRCTIELKLSGESLRNKTAILRIRENREIDETADNLILREDPAY